MVAGRLLGLVESCLRVRKPSGTRVRACFRCRAFYRRAFLNLDPRAARRLPSDFEICWRHLVFENARGRRHGLLARSLTIITTTRLGPSLARRRVVKKPGPKRRPTSATFRPLSPPSKSARKSRRRKKFRNFRGERGRVSSVQRRVSSAKKCLHDIRPQTLTSLGEWNGNVLAKY